MTQKTRKKKANTPLRAALTSTSTFLPLVEDSIKALKSEHRKLLDTNVRQAFADSLDLDEATKKGREEENRWDYLLGVQHDDKGDRIIAIEPHSAKTDEVSRVIEKRKAALQHLGGHLKDGKKVQKWLWVASKDVHFADTEKVRRQLDQNGIEFVGRSVQARHLL